MPRKHLREVVTGAAETGRIQGIVDLTSVTIALESPMIFISPTNFRVPVLLIVLHSRLWRDVSQLSWPSGGKKALTQDSLSYHIKIHFVEQ